ncbi:bacillithiol biosynthesis cysteine-adding enzyme BshC [Sanyastnella coralliicola]|uniref:bacillithiol biosynthesis cysteine-adding enzyme BshC n=1 Tax=Sanyastnella coralliicola TaxID=3069118 RepID=UPI0027B8B29E|nr:bacillithiol biosynthesis cysteine-adding enzyme BshC [Longitalea sp. SCSIO 12813]
MIIQSIAHLDLDLIPQGVRDLLSQQAQIQPLINQFADENGFEKAIASRRFHASIRRLTAERIRLQYGEHIVPEVSQQLEKFEDEQTFTVTTGHQLNLFTGPAFFFYKIIHTISLARRLNELHPGKHFIPVYWMATEDHDLDEIDHTTFFRQELKWERANEGAVGRMSTDGLPALAAQVKEILRWDDDHPKWKVLEAYANAQDLASATRTLVNELFGHEGLVVIDADDAELKRAFAGHMWRDIDEGVGKQYVTQQNQQLQELGYKVQVNPRDINLFYLTDNERIRLSRQGEQVKGVDTDHTWSLDEIQSELQAHPERFSPNVVMRPLYQEVILPNIAYIGGPGEMSYWIQLKSFFDVMEVDFPILLPRNGALILSASALAKVKKLSLEINDLFNERPEDFTRAWLDANTSVDFSLDEAKASIASIFEEIKSKATEVDQSLNKKVEGSLQRQLKEIEGIEKSMEKAWKNRQETSLRQLENLHDTVFPGGSFQERKQNFFGLESGFQANLVDILLKEMRPLEPGILVIADEK